MGAGWAGELKSKALEGSVAVEVAWGGKAPASYAAHGFLRQTRTAERRLHSLADWALARFFPVKPSPLLRPRLSR